MKKIVTILPLFLFSMLLYAQDSTENTLESQFDEVIEKSNRYQDYKVVKIFKLNNLRKSVVDSISELENTIEASQATIQKQADEIQGLMANLSTTEANLALSQEKEDGIVLFGSILKKSTYSTLLFSTIGVLILLLLFVFYKFKSSNAVTKQAREKLADIEAEFEGHRQRSLEREQQLRRKLQDEINKQK